MVVAERASGGHAATPRGRSGCSWVRMGFGAVALSLGQGCPRAQVQVLCWVWFSCAIGFEETSCAICCCGSHQPSSFGKEGTHTWGSSLGFGVLVFEMAAEKGRGKAVAFPLWSNTRCVSDPLQGRAPDSARAVPWVCPHSASEGWLWSIPAAQQLAGLARTWRTIIPTLELWEGSCPAMPCGP